MSDAGREVAGARPVLAAVLLRAVSPAAALMRNARRRAPRGAPLGEAAGGDGHVAEADGRSVDTIRVSLSIAAGVAQLVGGGVGGLAVVVARDQLVLEVGEDAVVGGE